MKNANALSRGMATVAFPYRMGMAGERPLAPLSNGDLRAGAACCLWFGVGEQRAIDDVRQPPLEYADRLGLGVAAGTAAFQEGLSFWVVVRLGDRDVERR